MDGGADIKLTKRNVITCTPEEALNTAQSNAQPKKAPKESVPTDRNNSGNADSQGAAAQSLYIKVTKQNESAFENALELASRKPGNSRILVYFESEKRLAAAKGRSANVTERLLIQLKELMGESNIAVK